MKFLNVVEFLDPSLHCNKFAAKAVGWFKPRRMVMYTDVNTEIKCGKGAQINILANKIVT